MERTGKLKKERNEYLESIDSIRSNWEDVPLIVKGAIYLTAGVAILWASKYVFSAIGGAVGSYREW